MASAAISIRDVPLGSIVRFVGGGTPSKSRPDFFTGDIPWVTPKDMKSLEIWNAIDHITEEAVRASTTSLIPPGSVLIVVRSGVLKHTFPAAINRIAVAINQDIKALICSDEICPSFLLRFLLYSAPKILERVRGTTADNIPVDELKSLRVVLPPLAEQRRIATILERADALSGKRDSALKGLDDLARSIFLDMFGEPGWNGTRWRITEFENIAEIKLGKMLDEKKKTGLHSKPYLRNANVQWHRFDLKNVYSMDFAPTERERFS